MQVKNVSNNEFEQLTSEQKGMPIVLCREKPQWKNILHKEGYIEICLNRLLSEKLIELPKSERQNKIENTVKEIINSNSKVYLYDFAMIFDPRYNIDALKLLCNIARMTSLVVKWPGTYRNGELIYATSQDQDYHVYDSDNYQIQIIL